MKDLKIYLFFASALLIVYMVAQYNRPKAVDWKETLNNEDKIPFGTYIAYNRLHDIFPHAPISTYREPVYNVLTEKQVKNSTYIIIANSVNLDEYDYGKLSKYIKAGNDVLIAASYFGAYFQNKLHMEAGAEFGTAKTVTGIRFVNKNLGDYIYAVDKHTTDGIFSKFDTAKVVVLGENVNHHVNFLKISMGKGSLYLNANPLIFSNYSLLQKDGAAYAERVLSHLKNNKSLVWDQFYTQGREGEESSMRVFLKYPSLRWSFYIITFSLLAFVLYQMKRKQRIIPIIPPLANTTVEFAKVVGQVYYEQRDNSNIAQKKAAYFLEFIRTRYNLKTGLMDDSFITVLAQKSGVTTVLVKELFYQIILIQSGHQVSNDMLITLNQNIQQFYIQSS
jgi:hypothetical protein